eukprot:14218662-Heterocapsa_arctica.AAC.1
MSPSSYYGSGPSSSSGRRPPWMLSPVDQAELDRQIAELDQLYGPFARDTPAGDDAADAVELNEPESEP